MATVNTLVSKAPQSATFNWSELKAPADKTHSPAPHAPEMTGYKGFKKTDDGKLKCLDMVYEIGKTYVMDGQPVACQKGFHFCSNLEDVNVYYKLSDSENVFYKVKAGGVIVKSGDKYVSNQIEVLEKVSKSEMKVVVLKNVLQNARAVMALDPDVILGGSLALMLMDVIPVRDCKDLDLISHKFTDFGGKGFVNQGTAGSGQDAIKMSVPGTFMDVDLFVDPRAIYTTVTYEGHTYKVNDPAQIALAKCRYLFDKKRVKHAKDLEYIMKTLATRNSMDFSR